MMFAMALAMRVRGQTFHIDVSVPGICNCLLHLMWQNSLNWSSAGVCRDSTFTRCSVARPPMALCRSAREAASGLPGGDQKKGSKRVGHQDRYAEAGAKLTQFVLVHLFPRMGNVAA